MALKARDSVNADEAQDHTLHDLRSSVRAVSIYVDLLQRELPNLTQDGCETYLIRLSETVIELSDRIDALALTSEQ